MGKIKIKDVIIFSIIAIPAVASFIIFLLGTIPIKYTTNKTLDGIKYKEDVFMQMPEYVTMDLEVYYENYIIEWWNHDSFEGRAYLSDWTSTRWWFWSNDDFKQNGWGYNKYSGVKGHDWTKLDIYYSNDLTKFVIIGHRYYDEEGRTKSDYPYYYVFPAENKSEAIAIGEEFNLIGCFEGIFE